MKNGLACCVLGAWLFAAGCGGGSGGVSIVGAEPAEQADEIADAICEREAECGSASISCTVSNNMTDCTGMIEPVSYDECYAEERPDILEDLENCNLTEAQETTIQTCINKLLGRSCITQAQLDAFVAEIEAGNEEATLGGPPPPECVEADAIIEACQPQ